MKRILFCNIGWMENYQGITSKDKIVGGGRHVAENKTGLEVCNFAPVDGQVFGFVQAGKTGLDIKRVGANVGDATLSDVLVVWAAKRPEGGTVVVGWYRNATIFREYQVDEATSPLHAKNGANLYLMVANAHDVKLLDFDQRTLEIPRQKTGFMGQSNVWYADSDEAAELVVEVLRLVKAGAVAPKPNRRKKGTPDEARKVLVEDAAIDMCAAHYEAQGFTVESVEKDNMGWDLEATKGRIVLRIEVKGLSGSSMQVELTPREFQAFSEHSSDYRLAVVNDALEDPKLSIARYSLAALSWLIEDDEKGKVGVEEKMGAIVRFSETRHR